MMGLYLIIVIKINFSRKRLSWCAKLIHSG